MNLLPPEDQPSGRGLVPGNPEDAVRDAGPMSPDNPVAVAAAFYSALMADDGPNLDDLRIVVTPESWRQWGDFRQARDMLTGYGMTTRVEHGAKGIAYARFVPDPGQTMVSDGDTLIVGVCILSLIWRPEIKMWQVHALGDYWRPDGSLVEPST